MAQLARIGALVALLAASVCAKPAAPAPTVPDSRLKVLRTYPHDPAAFTQGLLFLDGKLYESTGLYGRSSLRRVDLTSGQVEARVALPSDLFAEGLARVGDRLIQLTWKEGKALVWDLSTLHKLSEFSYEGEGWGLCYDGRRLVMSDGSDRLIFRNPTTFAKEGEVLVRRAGSPVRNLNELECSDGIVYANVWQDSHIARIDPGSGVVTAWISAAGLLDASEAAGTDVLNGIAEMSTTGHLLVTGKLWPHIYEVEVVTDAKGSVR
jgi:glutaminyl-peptide cyclotransferase